MQNIIGIRFQRVGKLYHFDASSVTDIQPGDFVVVETSRGRQLGEVVHFVDDPQPPPDGAWKPVQRKATPQDLVQRQIWQRREAEALVNCREKAKELNLVGIKFFAAEYSFDGSRLSFLYSTEEGVKIDFTPLRRALLRIYPHIQLDLHQIGPRDVAKLIGGMGACGLANRCCSMFLTDFSPVSIKMAKEQGISLTPTEITGMCGRLRCCLVYEYEQYVEARKHLPKRNKRVMTPKGEARVLDVIPMQDSVFVELENGVRQTYRREEIEPWDELSALRRKAEEGCGRHPDGNCECRKQPAELTEEELGYTGEAVHFRPETLGQRPAAPQPQKEKSVQGDRSTSAPAGPPQPRRSARRNKGRPRPKQGAASAGGQAQQQPAEQRKMPSPKAQQQQKPPQSEQRPPRQKQRPPRQGQKPPPQQQRPPKEKAS
ncbi:MAG: regulatory iron-sulfur-containing complex subunit RicT [Chloroflexota bacterium]